MNTNITEENENIVEVPVTDLLRVTPFKGHDDIRYYLNGVLVTPYEGHALLVATNGHWMAVYESEKARVDKERILDLPKWFVQQIDRIQRGERLDDDEVESDDDAPAWRPTEKTLVVASEKSRLSVREGPTEVLVKPSLPFIDGRFPDWKKVMPDPSVLEDGIVTPFAPGYFAALGEAVPDERDHPIFFYQQRENAITRPGIFRFGGMPGLVLLLMPRRDDNNTPGDWPAWMKKEVTA